MSKIIGILGGMGPLATADNTLFFHFNNRKTDWY